MNYPKLSIEYRVNRDQDNETMIVFSLFFFSIVIVV